MIALDALGLDESRFVRIVLHHIAPYRTINVPNRSSLLKLLSSACVLLMRVVEDSLCFFVPCASALRDSTNGSLRFGSGRAEVQVRQSYVDRERSFAETSHRVLCRVLWMVRLYESEFSF
jgi:hypothetical protein